MADQPSRPETRDDSDGSTPSRPSIDPDTHVDRWLIPLGLFGLAWVAYAWINNGRDANLDYFVPLADAFLNGRLGLVNVPSWLNEVVPGADGLAYVVYPPAPAAVLLPAVFAFGPSFPQVWTSIVIGALNVALVSMLVRDMGVGRGTRIVLSLVFAFGTIVWFSAQAGSSWHFAHVVALLFMLLAIRACQLDARPGLIGLLFGAAILSRLPLALATPFFLAYFADRAIREETLSPAAWSSQIFSSLHRSTEVAWRSLPNPRTFLEITVPFIGGVAILLVMYLLYNAARFGSPTENGYALIPGLLQEDQYRHGFFSIHNIPRKLYALFLTMPLQAPEFPWIQSRQLGGLSIVLTTPLFLWAIKARRPDWFGLGAWVSVVLVLVPILTHADPGGAQFGFRYGQDLYPLLFLLAVRGLGGRLSFEAWLAIAMGWLVHLWGMGSTYYNWWA